MDSDLSFGRRLKSRRVALRLTQAELAERIGYSTVTIRKIESDELRPSRQIAEKVAQQLQLPPEDRPDFIRFARGETEKLGRSSASSGRAPLAAVHRPLIHLPVPPTPLVGREQEVTAVQGLLRRSAVRLVTLTGAGGSGKTRLGLEVAARFVEDFQAGVCFVNLAPIGEPNLIASAIAATLGVGETAGQLLLETLKDYLREKHLLLLLDNFEQVIGAAPLVAELLGACPQLKVLVTSRERLHVRGEKEFLVAPLAVPNRVAAAGGVRQEQEVAGRWPLELTQYDAVELFLQRATDAQPDFALTGENAPAIAEICIRLDGLPLAIELAATRVRFFAPQSILARLERRIEFLTGGARDLPARQQTIRNTIAWSHDLLDDTEKSLFRRLSVFAGGFTPEAVAGVCNVDGDISGDIYDLLVSLVTKSLLQQLSGGVGEPRLAMLETIREFAGERLGESGEAETLRRQHADYFLAWAERAEPQLRGWEQLACADRFEAEQDNLRAALGWGAEHPESELGLELAGSLLTFWRLRGDWTEASLWLNHLLAGSQVPQDSPARARALFAAGIVDWLNGDFARAGERTTESAAIFRQRGDKLRLPMALGREAIMMAQGRDPAASRLGREAVALARETGDDWIVATTLHMQGVADIVEGNVGPAQIAFEESARRYRELGDRWGLQVNLRFLSRIAELQGKYDRADTLLRETLALAEELGNRFEAALAQQQAGRMAQLVNDYERAVAHYDASLALYRNLGHQSDIADMLLDQALLAQLQGDYDRSAERLREVTPMLRFGSCSADVARYLVGTAGLTGARGHPISAARLLGAAYAILRISPDQIHPASQMVWDRIEATVRSQVDENVFAARRAEGEALTREQALAYALADEP